MRAPSAAAREQAIGREHRCHPRRAGPVNDVLPGSCDPPGGGGPLTAVVSLMEGGDVEVRLVRAAAPPAAGRPPESAPAPRFGAFSLKKRKIGCDF